MVYLFGAKHNWNEFKSTETKVAGGYVLNGFDKKNMCVVFLW